MESLLKELIALHSEMESLTLKAGVPKSYYQYMVEFKGDIIESELQSRSDWLFKVRHNQYFRVLEIWRLLKPEIWKHYEDLGFQNLREQKLLRERCKELRTIWKQWYRANHEDTSDGDKDQEYSESRGVQPEAARTDGGSGFHERPIILREQGNRTDR